jgi:predicted CXXCH cytochrome family protein
MAFRRVWAAALLLLVAAPAAATGEQPSPPVPSASAQRLDAGLPRRCGVCHLERAPPPSAGLIVFAPPRGGGDAGTAAMCFSCHNGIVDDRRRQLGTGRHHPASGRVSCGSCHTPHVRETNVGTFMRFPRGSFSWCASCHPGRGGGAPGEHPAIAQDKGRMQDCGGCHAVHGAQGEGLIRTGSGDELCGPCHGENPSRAGRGPGMATHVTGKKGPSCLGCHGVHRTLGGKALLGKAAYEGRLCRQCHEQTYSPGRNETNHPVSPGGPSCLSCHRMHNAEKQQGPRRGLLAVAWEGAEEICRRCHAGLAGGPAADGPWSHPVGGKIAADQRSLGSRLARAGAFFAPGGRMTCLSCHRAHGGQAGTPQLVTARDTLCLHCHPAQNSLDPRQAALGAHPVSVRPRRAKIAADFTSAGGVTGPDGEIICTTCHRAHRGWSGTAGLVLPRESYSCLLCHSGQASVAATAHSTARAPGSAPPAEAGGLCGGCHGEHGWRLPLQPPKEGENAVDRICLSCHGGAAEGGPPVATNHPLGVAPAPGQGSGGLPLYWTDGRRYRHGVITCATCHDPHRPGSDGHFLRKGLGGATREQCLDCHRSQATVIGTRHDGPGAAGATCAPCHPVHDPLAVATWPALRGGGDRTTADLGDFCAGCHRAGGEAASRAMVERTHPAPARPGKKPIGCGGCHDPHRWNPLDAADRGGPGQGDARTSFLVRSAAGPAPLCAECHAGQALVAGTPHDLTGLAGGARGGIPDPQRHGVCAACHRAHSGQPPPAAVAQAGSRGPGEGAAPPPDPCERCHAEGGVAAGSAVGRTGHPVGIAGGQDFGPDLPLFGADGRRQSRGRIACATCHDPHRWQPAGGSGAGTRAATSFLRLGADGYAPLCFPCHADKAMVVGTDHDLRVTAPRAVNLAGEVAEASGVCGACHAVHRAPGGLALWNRGSGEGRDERTRICTGCHRPDNDQGARVPPRPEPHLVHYPGRGLVSRPFNPARMATPWPEGIGLFAEDGAPAERGYLSCASCHEVHRWESDLNSSGGAGIPVEGDLSNSFLRVLPAALEKTLCAECHAASLLEHYRNYHFPEGK